MRNGLWQTEGERDILSHDPLTSFEPSGHAQVRPSGLSSNEGMHSVHTPVSSHDRQLLGHVSVSCAVGCVGARCQGVNVCARAKVSV